MYRWAASQNVLIRHYTAFQMFCLQGNLSLSTHLPQIEIIYLTQFKTVLYVRAYIHSDRTTFSNPA